MSPADIPIKWVVLACLLPLGLAIVGLARASIFLRRYRREIAMASRERAGTMLLVVFVLIFAIFDLPFLLNQIADLTSNHWKYWLQTFTGNWSPDGFLTSAGAPVTPRIAADAALSTGERYEFSLSAVVAFWLNNALILALVGLVWRSFRERVETMKLQTAFAQRDIVLGTTITQAFVRLLPGRPPAEIQDLVRKSIMAAREEWQTQTLNDIYGPEVAERLRMRMKELSITP